MSEKTNFKDSYDATVQRGGGMGEGIKLRGHYRAVCRGKNGRVKWRDEILNVVTTVGKNDAINKWMLGSAYTQSLRMGLKGTGTAVAADTQASHASWNEVGLANAPAYSGNRPSVTMGAPSGGVSVSGGVVFTFTSGGTVAGAFINNGGLATKDDTTGVLVSAGDFTGGSKTVANTDTLTVTFTFTAS